MYLPRLRTDQWTIASNPARVKVLAMGRRWGKTILGGAVSLACARDGARVAWVVPTYRNGRPLWRWAEAAVAPLRQGGHVRINRAERLIEFPSNGGFLGIYSADNDSGLRGEAFHLVVIDEAARVPESTWTAVIQPTLADFDGRAILISTPTGRNWFWQEWERGRAHTDECAAFTAPSSANPNPRIQRAAVLARERVSDRTYREEWLAEFLPDGAGVFRNVADLATATPTGRRAQDQYVIGVDWGRSRDATVFSVINATTLTQVALDRCTDVEYAIQRQRLHALADAYAPDRIIAEANAMGAPIIEQLQRDGLPVWPFTTTNASKLHIIDGLALALERRQLTLLADPLQTAELQAYTSERLPGGGIRYGAPAGQHDDLVMALALAYHGAARALPLDPGIADALDSYVGF